MTSVKVRLEGHDELVRALDRLKASTARRVVRPAVNAALTPINKAAKRNLRRGHGQQTKALKKSIGKRVKLYKRSGAIWGGVGARDDPKFRLKDPKREITRIPILYEHLVERGTAPHSLSRGDASSGRGRGRSRNRDLRFQAARAEGRARHPGAEAKPFLEPALKANRGTALRIMASKIRQGLEKQARKEAAKAAASRRGR